MSIPREFSFAQRKPSTQLGKVQLRFYCLHQHFPSAMESCFRTATAIKGVWISQIIPITLPILYIIQQCSTTTRKEPHTIPIIIIILFDINLNNILKNKTNKTNNTIKYTLIQLKLNNNLLSLYIIYSYLYLLLFIIIYYNIFI